MKLVWLAVSVGLAGLRLGAAPASEDLARSPEFENAQISPDGKSVAILRHEDRGGVVMIWDLAAKKTIRFESWLVFDGDGMRPTAGIKDFRWLTPRRLLFRTEGSFFNDYTYADAYRMSVEGAIQNAELPANVSREDYRMQTLMRNAGSLLMAESELTAHQAVSGFFAADLDGKNRIEIPGASKDGPHGGQAYHLWDPDTLAISHRQPGSMFMAYGREAWHGHPVLGRIDAADGAVFVVAENPGAVDAWLLDWDELPRVGVERLATTTKLWQKPPGMSRWNELVDLGVPSAQLAFHRFDPTGKVLYASRIEAGGNWALYAYNLETRQWGEPQLRDARHDIAPGDAKLRFADADLTGPVFSERQRDLIGVRFVADGPRQIWFDASMAAAQHALDAVLPGRVNMILGMSEAEDRFVVLSWSARDPGGYFAFDRATRGAVRLAQRMPWIKPEEMGETFPFTCHADDGLELQGYITKPPGDPAGMHPLVVLLREEPWRRDVWGFDPWVQFLATRGYAVLQVNYRGSFGYGPRFHQKGVGEVGGAIQTDITAAVNWAIRSRLADPNRMAVVGRGFGGTCALVALGRDPARYRCGVAIAAVSDWVETLKNVREAPHRYWQDSAGLFAVDADQEHLRQASPIAYAGAMTAPVLLIHPTTAATAPIRETKALAAALEKAGHKPETLFYAPKVGPNGEDKDNAAIFRKIETFLADHLAASAPTR